jgi:hypothetical protein
MINKKQHKIQQNKNFNPEKAYQNLLEYYDVIKKEKDDNDNKILLQKIEKLTKGKAVVLENFSRAL